MNMTKRLMADYFFLVKLLIAWIKDSGEVLLSTVGFPSVMRRNTFYAILHPL